MPVLLARREPDYIARVDLLHLPAPTLRPAATGRDDESLPEWMRMPSGPCAGLEGYAGALNKRRIGRLKKRVDPYGASEPLGWSADGRLRANPFDFHTLYSSLGFLRPVMRFPNPSNGYSSFGLTCDDHSHG